MDHQYGSLSEWRQRAPVEAAIVTPDAGAPPPPTSAPPGEKPYDAAGEDTAEAPPEPPQSNPPKTGTLFQTGNAHTAQYDGLPTGTAPQYGGFPEADGSAGAYAVKIDANTPSLQGRPAAGDSDLIFAKPVAAPDFTGSLAYASNAEGAVGASVYVSLGESSTAGSMPAAGVVPLSVSPEADPWEETTDPNDPNRSYWLNTQTFETRWSKPDEDAGAAADSKGAAHEPLRSNPSATRAAKLIDLSKTATGWTTGKQPKFPHLAPSTVTSVLLHARGDTKKAESILRVANARGAAKAGAQANAAPQEKPSRGLKDFFFSAASKKSRGSRLGVVLAGLDAIASKLSAAGHTKKGSRPDQTVLDMLGKATVIQAKFFDDVHLNSHMSSQDIEQKLRTELQELRTAQWRVSLLLTSDLVSVDDVWAWPTVRVAVRIGNVILDWTPESLVIPTFYQEYHKHHTVVSLNAGTDRFLTNDAISDVCRTVARWNAMYSYLAADSTSDDSRYHTPCNNHLGDAVDFCWDVLLAVKAVTSVREQHSRSSPSSGDAGGAFLPEDVFPDSVRNFVRRLTACPAANAPKLADLLDEEKSGAIELKLSSDARYTFQSHEEFDNFCRTGRRGNVQAASVDDADVFLDLPFEDYQVLVAVDSLFWLRVATLFRARDELNETPPASLINAYVEAGRGKHGVGGCMFGAPSCRDTSSLQEKYDFVKQLDRGAQGAVWLVALKSTGAEMAIKRVEKISLKIGDFGGSKRAVNRELELLRKQALAAKIAENASREVGMLMRLRHPNIVRMFEHFESPANVYLVMELCRGGTLETAVNATTGGLPEEECKRYFRELTSAMAYLHGHDIMHRDIKPANVLFDKDDPETRKTLLADFGLAKRADTHSGNAANHTFVGTPAYASPEILDEGKYDHRSDLFSMGLLLWFMCSSGDISQDEESALATSSFDNVTFSLKMAGALSLLKQSKILSRDPTQRMEAKHMLKNRWLTEGVAADEI